MRVFGVCVILKQCDIFAPRFMPPLRGSHLFFGAVPGGPPLTGLHRRAIVWRPRALNLLRLRLAIFFSTSDLLSRVNGGIYPKL